MQKEAEETVKQQDQEEREEMENLRNTEIGGGEAGEVDRIVL